MAEVAIARAEVRKGHLAMLAFSGLVSGSFSLGGMVANEISPGALNSARFLLAIIVVSIIARATGALEAKAARAPWRYLILGTLFAIYFVTMFEGLKTAPPVSIAAMFTLTPLISAAVGRLVLGQGAPPRMLAALAIGAAGALWVIFRADIGRILSFHLGPGEVVFSLGCLAHGIYPVASRRLSRGEKPLAVTLGMLLAGFVVLLVYGWSDILATDWLNLPGMVYVTIVYTAVFAGATTFTLLQFASQRLPAAKVMAYTYLTPSWVALWEMSLGHGVPPVLVLAGVGLTVVALLMLLRDD